MLHAARLGLLVLLSACAQEAPASCEEQAWYADTDADGYGAGVPLLACEAPAAHVADGSDCDDQEAAVFPGAPEGCFDGRDSNCDGTSPTVDSDLDGWSACADCDDSDPSQNPSAVEFCDGEDDDCDGDIDEGAADARLWYADVDADGYGDPDASTLACEPASGFVEAGTDCDDQEGAVSPASVEACNGYDDDCDGGLDETDAMEPWYPDVDGDGYGDDARSERTCAPGEGWVRIGGDCDDINGLIAPEVEESCNGLDDDCDHDVDEDAADATLWYEDLDGDGWGNSATERSACDAPATWVSPEGDCDDADATVFPGAVELCDGWDDDCDGVIDEGDAYDADRWFYDLDGDGFAGEASPVRACDPPPGTYASALDCDDTTSAISPDADEYCDGADEDCDGVVDDGALDATDWFTDADGDGHGADTPTQACDAPAGRVGLSDDCDDSDGGISPSAIEACDGVDEDCDGSVDEGASDAVAWYVDADGDGYGASSTTSCEAPTGAVERGGDCDDVDAAIHPGAVEDCASASDSNCDGEVGTGDADADGWMACEDCDDTDDTRFPSAAESCDGVDEDCDGEADEDAVGSVWVYADLDADGYGDPSSAEYACAPGLDQVLDDTDCSDSDSTVSPGEFENCNTSVDDDCSGSINALDAVDCSDFYLDFDEDGSGSLTRVCMCEASGLYTAADADDCDDGDAAVSPLVAEIWGNGVDDDCDDEIDVVLLDVATATYEGGRTLDAAGAAVAGPGDVDGDGFADLLVGAPDQDTGGLNAGVAYLVLGGGSGATSLADSEAILLGDEASDDAGRSMAGKDLDGDGRSDLVIGAPGHDASSGAIYVLYGPLSGTIELSDANVVLLGEGTGDHAGEVVATGDLDGDGAGDVVIGGYGDDEGGSGAGAVWVVSDPTVGDALTLADAKLVGEDAGDDAGKEVASGADIDGDGVDDLLIGAPGDDDGDSDAGAAYLLLGPVSGTVDLFDNDGKYVGDYAGDELGSVVRFVRDIDGDGVEDLLIGSSSYGLAGGAWLHRGPGLDVHHRPNEALATWEGASSSDRFCVSGSGIGDVNGDGWNDLAIGASGVDASGSGAGAAYAWFGPVEGAMDPEAADTLFYGPSAGDAAGAAMAAVGDANGDGNPDILIGGTGDDGGASNAGAAWLMTGPGR